jgi:predicted nuclease with RNAse H fold
LIPSKCGLKLTFGPKVTLPESLMAVIDGQGATAVAIDGQLSLAFSEANGFRSSDMELRGLLPADCRNWVASANSLMAVPLRARLLADVAAPLVGTILETHPRASLYLELGDAYLEDIREYKRSPESVRRLSAEWASRFRIHGEAETDLEGALDAIVCATVAYCFHTAPERLRYLRHSALDRQGRGPFVVLDARNKSEDA